MMSPLTALTKHDSQDTNDHSAKGAGKPDSMYEKNTDDSSGYFKGQLDKNKLDAGGSTNDNGLK